MAGGESAPQGGTAAPGVADDAGDADDRVFRALAERHRRRLLDALRQRDGQSLGELCGVLPELTRFGVMKHLTVLGDAGLVLTYREGRTKWHYLNPVPIGDLQRRWISTYADLTLGVVDELRRRVEAAPVAAHGIPDRDIPDERRPAAPRRKAHR